MCDLASECPVRGVFISISATANLQRLMAAIQGKHVQAMSAEDQRAVYNACQKWTMLCAIPSDSSIMNSSC